MSELRCTCGTRSTVDVLLRVGCFGCGRAPWEVIDDIDDDQRPLLAPYLSGGRAS